LDHQDKWDFLVPLDLLELQDYQDLWENKDLLDQRD